MSASSDTVSDTNRPKGFHDLSAEIRNKICFLYLAQIQDRQEGAIEVVTSRARYQLKRACTVDLPPASEAVEGWSVFPQLNILVASKKIHHDLKPIIDTLPISIIGVECWNDPILLRFPREVRARIQRVTILDSTKLFEKHVDYVRRKKHKSRHEGSYSSLIRCWTRSALSFTCLANPESVGFHAGSLRRKVGDEADGLISRLCPNLKQVLVEPRTESTTGQACDGSGGLILAYASRGSTSDIQLVISGTRNWLPRHPYLRISLTPLFWQGERLDETIVQILIKECHLTLIFPFCFEVRVRALQNSRLVAKEDYEAFVTWTRHGYRLMYMPDFTSKSWWPRVCTGGDARMSLENLHSSWKERMLKLVTT